jgi:predicted phage terminase large subunit-like protein
VAEEGALVKREWWQDWREADPKCDAIIQSWDTAFTAKTSADYSVCTTWGVFETKISGKKQTRLILLDMIRGKWEFPDLKREFLFHYTKWKPSICLIEARASGQPLIYELRSMNIPVQDVTVGRGSRANPNDKISRLNSISDIFASKMVFINKSTKWADEVIEEVASFPHGEHDDIVDSTIHALTRFRHGGWIGTELDDDDEDDLPVRRRAAYY